MAQEDWDKLAKSEAEALALLLERPHTKVMVIVIGAEDDAAGTCHMVHGVAGATTGAHLRQFIFATERKLNWLRDKLYRRIR